MGQPQVLINFCLLLLTLAVLGFLSWALVHYSRSKLGRKAYFLAPVDWSLVVSIRGKGVYRFTKKEWSLIAGSPYPSAAGEYWTYLSASGGKLALAINAKPVVDSKNSRDSDLRFM
jgi:hypothetical protein